MLLSLVALALALPSHALVKSPIEIDFLYGIDEQLIHPEITHSGGGNGEFNMYVNSMRTSYVKNKTLFIKPALSEHVMDDLQAAGTLFVAKTRAFINNTAQPWTYDNDFYYGGAPAGRRMLLPYKHTRYQTDLNNTCDDTQSASPDPATCTNQWEHAYNVMDMSTQAWASGRWENVQCAHDCILTSGDYVQEGSEYTYNMLQPISSARLVTRVALDMRYGQLEVTAKLPRGDWLWPAIWLLPSHPDNYGGWPMSGEIDVMESRGNEPSRCPGGYNRFGSTLHWGPSPQQDMYAKTTTGLQFDSNTSAVDDFHVYGLVWNATTISTYIDDVSNIVFSKDVSQTNFWQFGQQASADCVLKNEQLECVDSVQTPPANWSNIPNPWANPFDAHMAPFDTPFYLIMNVAVGGSNGYFAQDCNAADGSPNPWARVPDELPTDVFMKEGYRWLPTWVEPENIAWAAHCSLGSAYELCMPANDDCPVKDMTQDAASDKLRSWYEASAATCTGLDSGTCGQQQGCEWHASPCPPTADHAAMQIKSIKYIPQSQ